MASENLPPIPPFPYPPPDPFQSNNVIANYYARLQAHLNAFKKHNNAKRTKLPEELQKAIDKGINSYDKLQKLEKKAATAAIAAKEAENALQKAIASNDKNQLEMLKFTALHKKQIENHTKASVNHAQKSLNTDNRMINFYERSLRDWRKEQREKKDSNSCGPFGCFSSAARDGGSRKRSARSKRKTHHKRK